jgi:serine/threonine protein kinase
MEPPAQPLWQFVPQSGWGTSPASLYREERQVGEGTYGQVYLGSNVCTNQTLALKKVRLGSTDSKHYLRGMPRNALREIRLLKNKVGGGARGAAA